MNTVKTWKLAIYGITGFIIGILMFLPWSAVGDYVMVNVLNSAAENGIYATVRKNLTKGILDKEFVYLGVQADFPVFSLFLKEVDIDPSLISSICTAKPSCSVSLDRGEIMSFTRQKLGWKSGSAKVSVDGDIVYVNDIEFIGELSAKGFIEISMETGEMLRAKLTIKVPEGMDRSLQMLGNTGIIPISKIKAGEWKVER